MKMTFVVAVLYNVFVNKRIDMAYFRTIVSLTMALIVHLLQIGFIFGIINTLFPIGPTTDPGQLRFVKMGFIFLLIYRYRRLGRKGLILLNGRTV
jgi:uncharacterized protein YdiU (UPF0061 family)